MSNKTEIYYKFIFPTYDSLSTKTDNQPVTSDGLDQIGEVKALCDACPDRVITYDKLNTTLKSYVDAWVSIPKYFNLRNYWDANPCQEGGMSLIVSHTPENLGNPWTKFTVGSKTIYCSLVVSSGDFFYGFTLPDEVIEKSGLRDEVVKLTQFNVENGKTLLLRFHSNWCINTKEKYVDGYNDVLNTQVGQEKRVFVQHYFNNGFNYGGQASGNAFYRVDFIDNDNNAYRPFSGNIHCIDTLGNNKDEQGYPYTGSFKNLPPPDYVKYYYINEDIPANRVSIRESTSDESEVIRVVEHASDYAEDLKHDFIDLEATRRILFYHNKTQLNYKLNAIDDIRDIHPTRDIPHIIGSATGKDTTVSYEPPDEYLNKDYTYTYNSFDANGNLIQNSDTVKGTPPLQIPYNLLRYCLNDRPPFSDCETVLVMWVADSDPNNVADGDVAALHALDWQQYAIPISVRCCFKDDTYNTDRFLVLYPHGETGEAKDEYAFHFRRSAKYDGSFKEALYLQDLIRYSNDYIISYRNITYSNYDAFDIQRHLLSKASTAFRELYVRKAYNSGANNRENQFYYVKVNSDAYDINSTSTSLKTCFVNPGTVTQFKPSEVLTSDKYIDWDLDNNDWKIRDDWFIALFDKSVFDIRSGTLTLVDATNLKSKLNDIASDDNEWNDIYLSSFGISPYNQTNKDFLKLADSYSGSMVMLPLDVLDGHIQIGDIRYGSTINNKVVIGFKDVFDYTDEGYHHFKYINGSYVLANENQDYLYTAYVMSST